ncbi:hypothetical protein BGX26_008279, partial [Mortierella sp. AD094]
MFGSGGHFCCTVVIDGRQVFYDGMKERKLRWQDRENYEVPDGYQVNQVWYLRKREPVPSVMDNPNGATEEIEDLELIDSLKPTKGTESQTDTESEDWEDWEMPDAADPFNALPDDTPGLPESTQKPTKKSPPKPLYPMGLSTSQVSRRGRAPTCDACK